MMDLISKLKSNLTDMDNMPRMKSERCTSVEDTEAAIAEIERLQEKCNKQAMVLRRAYPENNPDTYFICGEIGEKDRNGMPKYIEVCCAFGVDWSYIYERSERIMGGMGS